MTDAIVVGAGAAGLAAAARLAAAGLRVELLEARHRIGGRIHTLHAPHLPLPVELGAEFVHGHSEALWSLIRGEGLAFYEVADRHHLAGPGGIEEAPGLWDEVAAVLQRADPDRTEDRPVSALLQAADPHAPSAPALRLARWYVEGFHAAPADRMSERALARAERGGAAGGSDAARLPGGYDAVAAALARRLDRPNATLRLGAVVREVRWERGRVEVEYRDAAGATGRAAAPRAVITLPLGVLQRPPGETGTVRFDPPLEAKREPLARLDMGTVVRLVLHFERIWWDERLSFLHVPESEGFPIWWTPAPLEAPYLTGWAGGPRAERLAALGEEALVQRAVTELAHALGERASRVEALLLEAFHHDWSADPFARGAYSYAVVGGSDAPDLLAEPIEETLFFAGEATAGDGTNGTVQGALTTGTRAANRLLGAGGNR